MSKSFIMRPGEGREFTFGFAPGYRSIFKVVSSDTEDNTLSASIEDVPPSPNHSRHIHQTRDELFLVTAGSIEFWVGDEKADVPAGSIAFAARGVAHSFANLSDTPAQMLAVWCPGGTEDMYAEWAEVSPPGSTVDIGKLVEIWRRYDTEPVFD